MPANEMRQRLDKGEVLYGMGNMLPASGLIEGMTKGWDLVWIDTQHGQFNYRDALHACQAAMAVRKYTMIRPPGQCPDLLGQYADLASDAMMVPMVDNVEQAKAINGALRFPPLGQRSYGGRRVCDLWGRDYYKESDLIFIAQIETIGAVERAGEIAAVEGVDALFFGPDDMRVSMGISVNTPVIEHPKLREAMGRVAEAAKAAGKFAGIVAVAPEAATVAKEMGYQLIIGGADIVLLRTAAAAKIAELKGEAPAAPAKASGSSYA